MTSPNNPVNPEPGMEVITNERTVRDGFKRLILEANTHTRRLDKLDDIDRDKQINADLNKRIEQADDPFVKSSLWFKLFRTFEIQAELLPKTTATKKDGDPVILNTVDSTKDLIFEDGNYDDTYIDINNDGFRKEGITFVEIGFNNVANFISLKRHEFSNVFTDYDKDKMANDQSDEDPKGARWAAVRVGMEMGQALQMYPHLEGKIQKGDFLAAERTGVLNANAGNSFSPTANDKVWLYFCWSIINKDPQSMVFVGGNAEVAEYHEGKDYPYWVKRNSGEEYGFVPIIDMHFTRTGGEGMCTMSQIGVMADVAGADQKISNISLPGIKKVVNKIIAVWGPEGSEDSGADAETRDEIMLAQERQALGINPVIPLPAGTQIDTISPDSGIIGEYKAARSEIYAMASDRFDIDFVRLSNDDVKATVFVGKTKTEIQAISGLYKLNRGAFNKIAEYSVALAAKNWKTTDERSITVTLDKTTEDTTSVNASVVMAALEDWTGRFVTDVDIKIPLSTSDKSDVMQNLANEEFGIFYGRPWKSIDEINRDLTNLNERARLAGLEDKYKIKDLLAKAEAMLATNPAAASATIPSNGAAGAAGQPMNLDTVNQDVAKELAPQTALAEAGV